MREIQIETAKEFQVNPAQYAPFILNAHKEAIDEIKQLMDNSKQYYEHEGKEYCDICPDEETRGKIELLKELFELEENDFI